jgi:hypothetical protein
MDQMVLYDALGRRMKALDTDFDTWFDSITRRKVTPQEYQEALKIYLLLHHPHPQLRE